MTHAVFGERIHIGAASCVVSRGLLADSAAERRKQYEEVQTGAETEMQVSGAPDLRVNNQAPVGIGHSVEDAVSQSSGGLDAAANGWHASSAVGEDDTQC